MEDIQFFQTDELCRLCLSRKSATTSFIKINENHRQLYKQLTQKDLPLNDNYPQYACLQCCNDLDSFNTYKNRLITRQEELEIILHNYAVTEEYLDEESLQSDTLYVEETENKDEENIPMEMPSVKNLSQPNSMNIVKLIEEIEKRNQMIFESSKPTVTMRKRSAKKKLAMEPKDKIKIERVEQVVVIDKSNRTSQLPYKEKHECTKCKEKFVSQFLLKRHMAQAHPEKSMKCCDQVFKFIHEYKKHLVNCPSSIVTCNMPGCSKVLKNKKTFQIHLKSHLTTAERKFKCSWKNCKKIHLENHLRIHKNEKCFDCPQCSLAFKQKHQIVKQKH